MAPKGFKCTVEVTIELLVSPGTWLPNRDELYLTIDLFNQVKRSRLLEPVFPLRIHERFRFEKNFWPATDPQDVAEMLEELPVTLELRQVTDVYLGSCLLAYFDSNGREFLYPDVNNSSKPTCHRGREALLARTVDFVGVSPKLEFSTYTAVEEMHTSYSRTVGDDFGGEMTRPRSRARSQPRQQQRQRLTIADDERRRQQQLERQYQQQYYVDGRPPFVVRHVDRNLTGRKPALHNVNTRLNNPRQLESSSNVSRAGGGGAGFGSGSGGSAGSSPVHRNDQQRRRRPRHRSQSAAIDDPSWYYERTYVPFGHEYPEWGDGERLGPVPPGAGASVMSSQFNPVLAASVRHRAADRYGEAPPRRRRHLRDSCVY